MLGNATLLIPASADAAFLQQPAVLHSIPPVPVRARIEATEDDSDASQSDGESSQPASDQDVECAASAEMWSLQLALDDSHVPMSALQYGLRGCETAQSVRNRGSCGLFRLSACCDGYAVIRTTGALQSDVNIIILHGAPPQYTVVSVLRTSAPIIQLVVWHSSADDLGRDVFHMLALHADKACLYQCDVWCQSAVGPFSVTCAPMSAITHFPADAHRVAVNAKHTHAAVAFRDGVIAWNMSESVVATPEAVLPVCTLTAGHSSADVTIDVAFGRPFAHLYCARATLLMSAHAGSLASHSVNRVLVDIRAFCRDPKSYRTGLTPSSERITFVKLCDHNKDLVLLGTTERLILFYAPSGFQTAVFTWHGTHVLSCFDWLVMDSPHEHEHDHLVLCQTVDAIPGSVQCFRFSVALRPYGDVDDGPQRVMATLSRQCIEPTSLLLSNASIPQWSQLQGCFAWQRRLDAGAAAAGRPAVLASHFQIVACWTTAHVTSIVLTHAHSIHDDDIVLTTTVSEPLQSAVYPIDVPPVGSSPTLTTAALHNRMKTLETQIYGNSNSSSSSDVHLAVKAEAGDLDEQQSSTAAVTLPSFLSLGAPVAAAFASTATPAQTLPPLPVDAVIDCGTFGGSLLSRRMPGKPMHPLRSKRKGPFELYGVPLTSHRPHIRFVDLSTASAAASALLARHHVLLDDEDAYNVAPDVAIVQRLTDAMLLFLMEPRTLYALAQFVYQHTQRVVKYQALVTVLQGLEYSLDPRRQVQCVVTDLPVSKSLHSEILCRCHEADVASLESVAICGEETCLTPHRVVLCRSQALARVTPEVRPAFNFREANKHVSAVFNRMKLQCAKYGLKAAKDEGQPAPAPTQATQPSAPQSLSATGSLFDDLMLLSQQPSQSMEPAVEDELAAAAHTPGLVPQLGDPAAGVEDKGNGDDGPSAADVEGAGTGAAAAGTASSSKARWRAIDAGEAIMTPDLIADLKSDWE